MNLVARLEYSGDAINNNRFFATRYLMTVAFRAVSARIEVVGNIGRLQTRIALEMGGFAA